MQENTSLTIADTPHALVHRIIAGAFMEGKGYRTWRSRGTEDWLLIQTVAGKGRFGHDGGEFVASAPDLVLIRPGTRHDYGVAVSYSHWGLTWAHFVPRPHWLDWIEWPEQAPGLFRLRIDDDALWNRISERFLECVRLAGGSGRRREDFAMNALEEVLLWCDSVNPLSEQGRMDSRVRSTMEYVCERYHTAIGLPEMARNAGLSESRLGRLFHAETGLTPHQFLELQRMQRAKELLEVTDRPIQTIAESVGFESPFYFTLRFKNHAGCSPTEYRKRLLEEGYRGGDPIKRGRGNANS